MRGRKPKQESRSVEFRQRLIAWKQTSGSLRPSLRTLACQLGTSHQLLAHYLKGIEKWQAKEYFRKATEIRTRAHAQGRTMTQWEEQQAHDLTRAGIRAMMLPAMLDTLRQLKEDAERGPLHPAQIKMARMFARYRYPGAQEVLQKCLQVGPKEKKRFADIVKETPRQGGEASVAWVRRIWDQCSKYDTKCPRVITDELLEKCSRGKRENHENNLPPISEGAAKSFRTAPRKTHEGWQLR